MTERRESLRGEFLKRYLPLVKPCKSPGEAALLLNKSLFRDYRVGYNTRRLRPDQSSRESIAQGMATCTGLSIMLIEACRAVAIPARLAGIQSWPGRGGNHTWVEVWDDGWHFVGAAEPDAQGLDHAWFAGEAAGAIKDSPRNAIFAVTYRATGDHFPMVWDPATKINAENVTLRYKTSAPPVPSGPRLMVEVRMGGQRVEADVFAIDRRTGAVVLSGKSLGPQADVNLHLSKPVTAGQSFLVAARLRGRGARGFATVREDTVVRLDLDQGEGGESHSGVAALLADRFSQDTPKRDLARKLLAEVPFTGTDRDLAWKAYRQSLDHSALRAEFDSRMVTTRDRSSPYLWRHVGTMPKEGWPLVIAMHGGGGAPNKSTMNNGSECSRNTITTIPRPEATSISRFGRPTTPGMVFTTTRSRP